MGGPLKCQTQNLRPPPKSGFTRLSFQPPLKFVSDGLLLTICASGAVMGCSSPSVLVGPFCASGAVMGCSLPSVLVGPFCVSGAVMGCSLPSVLVGPLCVTPYHLCPTPHKSAPRESLLQPPLKFVSDGFCPTPDRFRPPPAYVSTKSTQVVFWGCNSWSDPKGEALRCLKPGASFK